MYKIIGALFLSTISMVGMTEKKVIISETDQKPIIQLAEYLEQVRSNLDGQPLKANRDYILKECKVLKSTCTVQKIEFFKGLMRFMGTEAQASLALIHLINERSGQITDEQMSKFYGPNKYYTIGLKEKCGNNGLSASKTNVWGKKIDKQISKLVKIPCDKKQSYFYAVADLDGDAQMDTWRMDKNKQIVQIESDTEQFNFLNTK
jgi:hypothetical protein